MIIESNIDLSSMIKHLDSKVIELRLKYPKSNSFPCIRKFYQNVVIPWMEEYQLIGKEVDDEYDERLKNFILNWINTINKILRK
jgi:hypothetical protein